MHLRLFAANLIREGVTVAIRFRLETRDGRAGQRIRRRAQRLGARLRIHLAAAFRHHAMKPAIEVGIPFGGMIVIAQFRRGVTVDFIQSGRRCAIRFRQPVNGITIQRKRHGIVGAHILLQVQRRNVIMIIIRPSRVPAIVVQFAGEIGVRNAVVFDGIKNRHPVHGNGDGSAKKMRLGRNGLRRHLRLQRQPPRIIALIGLRQRDLLLPGGDTHHQRMRRHAIGLNVKELIVPMGLHLGRKGLKQRGHGRRVIGGARRGIAEIYQDIRRRLSAAIVIRPGRIAREIMRFHRQCMAQPYQQKQPAQQTNRRHFKIPFHTATLSERRLTGH